MIYIIRHGQTANNKAKVLQGRSNALLNDTGREQAEEARKQFAEAGIRFDRIYCSPLTRAVQTAGIIDKDAVPVIDERLIEMDYGPYEGMDLSSPAPAVLNFFRDFVNTPEPEGMEPLRNIVSRLGEFLEDIREESIGKNILVSTHAIAMKGALEYLTPESRGGYWSKYIGNCTVYTAEALPDGTWSVPVLWTGQCTERIL